MIKTWACKSWICIRETLCCQIPRFCKQEQLFSNILSGPACGSHTEGTASVNSLRDEDFDRVTKIFTKCLLTWQSSKSQIFPSTLNLLLKITSPKWPCRKYDLFYASLYVQCFRGAWGKRRGGGRKRGAGEAESPRMDRVLLGPSCPQGWAPIHPGDHCSLWRRDWMAVTSVTCACWRRVAGKPGSKCQASGLWNFESFKHMVIFRSPSGSESNSIAWAGGSGL